MINMTTVEPFAQLKLTNVELNSRNGNFDKFFDQSQFPHIYVDVGGYDGDTVIEALKYNPNLRVLVIEPIKELCELMTQRFQYNPNIIIVNKAVYSKQCNLQFNEYDGGFKGLSTI